MLVPGRDITLRVQGLGTYRYLTTFCLCPLAWYWLAHARTWGVAIGGCYHTVRFDAINGTLASINGGIATKISNDCDHAYEKGESCEREKTAVTACRRKNEDLNPKRHDCQHNQQHANHT
eukprot:1622306-Rhodomonas_salina.1